MLKKTEENKETKSTGVDNGQICTNENSTPNKKITDNDEAGDSPSCWKSLLNV